MEETEKTEHEILMNKLKAVVSSYLNDQVTIPSLETVEKDFNKQDKLASLLLIVQETTRLVQEKGIDIDKEFLTSLPLDEIEKRMEVLGRFLENDEIHSNTQEGIHKDAYDYLRSDNSQKYLLAYFEREINWIIISILSASYISALVLMRAAFELLVGVATRNTGKMKDRLNSIKFLINEEAGILLRLWYYLCGWGHPYGRWVKEVCPGYVAHKPLYHAELCAICLEKLQKIVDLFVIIALQKYEIPVKEFMSEISNHDISLADFDLVSSRVKG